MPIASTLPDINPDEFLSALDVDTRDYLKLLLNPPDDVAFERAVTMPRRGVGDQAMAIGPHDVAVVPGWMPYSLHAGGDDWALFSYSDRVVHEKLGFWREQRDPAA